MDVMTVGDARHESTPSDDQIRLQAQFWHSPFAVCAAAVVTSQFMIMTLALVNGRPIPYDILTPLTFLAATTLTAGIWPAWNFLTVNKQRLEQAAGLTGVTVDWDEVRSVNADGYGIELKYLKKNNPQLEVKAARIYNRYGLPADKFADLIETAWQKGATAKKQPAE